MCPTVKSLVTALGLYNFIRESSFNMTRGRGGGDEDIEGGLRKFLDTQKEGSEKIRGGGGSENL